MTLLRGSAAPLGAGAALLAACLCGGAIVSVLMGQDANYDLLSYHLQNGAALLRGRFDRDLMPAGMQSYLNPLLDWSYAALALGPLHDRPRGLAAVMGLWSGLAAYFAARLSMLLNDGAVRAAAGFALAVSGAALTSQTGTTTGEVPAAAIMLAGLFALLRSPSPVSTLVAGLLFGAAAGLKLTAAALAPAACLAAAGLAPGLRRSLAAGALFSAGWVAGIAATDGWQAWRLLERFGSPTFPMFNGLFRSPWYPPASVIDGRFAPHGLAQWLLYPLLWLAGRVSPADQPASDPRLAVALCLCVAAAVAWVARRRSAQLSRAQRSALTFLSVGYATWLATSAILRYAAAIEVTAGVLAPVLLGRVVGRRASAPASAAALALCAAVTRYPATPRAPFAPLAADLERLEPGALVVISFRGPSSYALALIPHQEDFAVVGVNTSVLEARGWPLHDEAVRRIRDHPGRIVAMTEGDPRARFAELGEVGLDPELSGCRPVATTFAPASPTGLHVCDARRLDPPPMPSPFWAQAARRYRTLDQPGDASHPLIGAAYLRAAGPAARGTRFVDWTELVWSGVGALHDRLPDRPDPGTLYVLAPEFVAEMAARIDPEADAIGTVDGVVVAAPGWRRCTACDAAIEPLATGLPGSGR